MNVPRIGVKGAEHALRADLERRRRAALIAHRPQYGGDALASAWAS
jgi:hypothetical protein